MIAGRHEANVTDGGGIVVVRIDRWFSENQPVIGKLLWKRLGRRWKREQKVTKVTKEEGRFMKGNTDTLTC